jgi:PAS domain S-box-containing protein
MATVFGVVTALVGAAHMVAWFSGHMLSRGGGTVTMKTNTALALLLEGLGLVLLASPRAGFPRRCAGRGLAALAALIGLLSLSENLLGWNLGIDQLLASEPAGALGVAAPNLMGTPASVCFILAGMALLIYSRRDDRGTRTAQGFALTSCLIVLLGTIGYLYGAQNFYLIARFTGIAWPTALALLMLSLGLLLVKPTLGLMAQVTADDAGGANLRRWLPVLLLPVALGWIRLVGERRGLFDAATGTAMMMIIFIVALAVLAYTGGRSVSRSSADLRSQREWFHVTLSSIGDAVIATDAAGRITFLNPVAEELTGWKEQEILGHPSQDVFRIINEKTRQPAEDIVQRVLLEGHVIALANHTALVTKNGCQIPIEDSAAPIKDQDGKVSGVVLVFHDVSEKRQAHEALLQNEERYRNLFDNMTEAFALHEIVTDEQGHPCDYRFLDINTSFERITGLNRGDIVNRNVREVLPGIEAFWIETYGKVALTGEPISFEKYYPASLNRWYEVFAYRPRPRQFAAIFMDVSQRKQAEQARQAALDRFYLALSNMTFATLLVNEDGRVEFANQAFCDMFSPSESPANMKNLTSHEVLERIGSAYLNPVDAVAHIRETVERGLLVQDEDVPMLGGRTILRDFIPIRLGDNDYGRLWIHKDITERKRAEQALREAKDELELRVRERTAELIEALQALRQTGAYTRSLIESSLDPLVTIGRDGTITDVNAATETATGRERQELIGTDFSAYFTEPEKARAGNQHVFTEGSVCDYPLDICHRDGHTIPVLYNAALYRDEAGQVVGIFAAARDITRLKRAEVALRRSNEQLRRIASELMVTEQRERQRLAHVLHDGLQQILVGAKFRLALLERDKDAQQATGQIRELIDDAIETSRSLSAELSPPILLQGDFVAALEWLARWMHDKHGIDVNLTARAKIAHMKEDAILLLFQAARELLFNVVKHAGVKNAYVEVNQLDGHITMTVEDKGVGFDQNRLPHRGGHSSGTGLFGISERLSYIGGGIEIDSAQGRGSRFRLTVPVSAANAGEDRAEIEKKALVSVAISAQLDSKPAGMETKIRIALVDDHIVVRQGLAGLLRAEPDIEIIGEASDGQSAIELIHDLRPDVVLMDINMPGMDGIQATRIIHKELPEVRIIGLSMFQEGEQQAAMQEAGAAEYLSKSGPSEALIKAIRACSRVSGKCLSCKSIKRATSR